MRATSAALLAASVLALPALTFGGEDKGKPRLDLKANPRFAFSPVTVALTANVVGGVDVEEWHCPELEWDWDDGGKSVRESDCEPLEPGAQIQRRFTASHQYRQAGIYMVKLTLRRGEKPLAVQTVKVTVKAGLGDPSIED
jgi:PKD repeat protein